MFYLPRWAALFCLLASCLNLNAYGDVPKTEPRNFTLHSTEPFQAVHIPFTLLEGKVILPVTIDGKTQQWMLDTGSTETSWSRGSAVRGKETGYKKWSHEALGQRHNEFFTVVPKMEMGNYERRFTPGYAVELTKAEQATVETKGNPRLLSCSFFSDIVLTLDYAKHELVVRNPAYDPGADTTLKNARTFDFKRLSPDAKHDYGWVAINATIAGKPCVFALDTGFSTETFGLALFKKKYDSLLPFLKAQVPGFSEEEIGANISTQGGTKHANYRTTSAIPILLGRSMASALTLQTRALEDVDKTPLIDGILGSAVLQNYRITFDFPRQKIVFEPVIIGNTVKDSVTYDVFSDGTVAPTTRTNTSP